MPNCAGIFQAYGMTETSLAATKDFSDENIVRKPGSGGYPLSGVRVKVSYNKAFGNIIRLKLTVKFKKCYLRHEFVKYKKYKNVFIRKLLQKVCDIIIYLLNNYFSL